MFDWTIDEARRDRIAREWQKVIVKAGGRRMPNGEALLSTPETVEALLDLVASLLDGAPQCAAVEGMDATAAAMGHELARLLRNVRPITGGRWQ